MSLVRRVIYILFALAILLVGILFSSHNNQLVSIDYLIGRTDDYYLSFWLISSFVLGGLIGVFVSGSTIFRLRSQQRRAEKKVKHSEVELRRLKGGAA